jgi:hypothetical protein
MGLILLDIVPNGTRPELTPDGMFYLELPNGEMRYYNLAFSENTGITVEKVIVPVFEMVIKGRCGG